MKKIIPMILVLSLCLCMSGCNGQAEQSEDENSVAASAEELSGSQPETLFEEEKPEDVPAILTGGELYAPDFDNGFEVYVEEGYLPEEGTTHILWRAEDDFYKKELYQVGAQLQCYRERSPNNYDWQTLFGGTAEILPSVYFITEKYGYAVIPLNWDDSHLRMLDGILMEELEEQPCFVVYRVDLSEKPSSLSALEYTRFYPHNHSYVPDSLNGEDGIGWISLLPPENYEEWNALLDSAGSGNCTVEEELRSHDVLFGEDIIYDARVDDLNISGGELYAPDFENGYKVFVEEGYDWSGTAPYSIWEVTDPDVAEEFLNTSYQLQYYYENELFFNRHVDSIVYLLTENYGYIISPLNWENPHTVSVYQYSWGNSVPPSLEEWYQLWTGMYEMQICVIYRVELTSNGLTDSITALEELRQSINGRDSVNHSSGRGWFSTVPEEIFDQIIAFPEQINETNGEVILTIPGGEF